MSGIINCILCDASKMTHYFQVPKGSKFISVIGSGRSNVSLYLSSPENTDETERVKIVTLLTSVRHSLNQASVFLGSAQCEKSVYHVFQTPIFMKED